MFNNKLFILLLVVFITGFSFSGAAQKDELIQQIYAYYPLDGNLIDQGPNQLNGEQISDKRSTVDRFGNKDRALAFTGKGEVLNLPVDINPETMPQITIALWLKAKNLTGLTTILFHNDGGFDRSIIIDGRKEINFLSVLAGENQKLYGGMNIPQNKWFFTAVSWNAENGRVSLYLIDQNNNFRSISTNNIYPGKGKDTIQLGGNPDSENFFIGSMDQLMIWDQILSRDQIKSLAF